MSATVSEKGGLTPRQRELAGRLLDEFLEREFGEEMARVCRLPLAERKAYIDDIIDHARAKGVSFEKPATGVTP